MNIHVNIICRVIPAPVPASNWNKREIILVSLCAALIFASLAFNLFSYQKSRRLSAENEARGKDNSALKEYNCALHMENKELKEENCELFKRNDFLAELAKIYKGHGEKQTETAKQIGAIYSH